MPGVVVANQPGVYLVDADGNVVTLADAATIGSAEGFLVAGKDGTVARFVKVSSASRLVVDGSEVTQPISAASLPLPSGAATDSGLAAILAELGQKTEPTDTQPVSAASLPLPTGAATQATLATLATEATLAAASAKLPAALVGGRLDENVGAWLGSTAPTVGQKTMAASVPVALSSDQAAIPVTQNPSEEATYTALASNVVLGNGKSMLGILNPSGSGYKLKLREVYLRNSQTSAVTGVAAAFQLHPIRASTPGITGGTDVTPVAHDSTDALPDSMVCKTGGTVAGETTTPFDIMRISSDEWGPGTLDVEGHHHGFENYMPARVKRDAIQKPFVLNAGQGVHLKCATNTTAGAFDVIFIFTKAAA